MTIIRVEPSFLQNLASKMQDVGAEVVPLLGSIATSAIKIWYVVVIELTQ